MASHGIVSWRLTGGGGGGERGAWARRGAKGQGEGQTYATGNSWHALDSDSVQLGALTRQRHRAQLPPPPHRALHVSHAAPAMGEGFWNLRNRPSAPECGGGGACAPPQGAPTVNWFIWQIKRFARPLKTIWVPNCSLGIVLYLEKGPKRFAKRLAIGRL